MQHRKQVARGGIFFWKNVRQSQFPEAAGDCFTCSRIPSAQIFVPAGSVEGIVISSTKPDSGKI
ncbi:hypothetical protein DC498_00870 [Terrimonas sp.]|nr:hypothetical protein DC498_00870 [Terrimonas sp.]